MAAVVAAGGIATALAPKFGSWACLPPLPGSAYPAHDLSAEFFQGIDAVPWWFNTKTPVLAKNLTGRPTLLLCWGTYCGSCLEEFRTLSKLFERYPELGGLSVILATDEDPGRVERFLERRRQDRKQIDWTTAAGAKELFRVLGITEVPATFLYKPGRPLVRASTITEGSLPELRDALAGEWPQPLVPEPGYAVRRNGDSRQLPVAASRPLECLEGDAEALTELVKRLRDLRGHPLPDDISWDLPLKLYQLNLPRGLEAWQGDPTCRFDALNSNILMLLKFPPESRQRKELLEGLFRVLRLETRDPDEEPRYGALLFLKAALQTSRLPITGPASRQHLISPQERRRIARLAASLDDLAGENEKRELKELKRELRRQRETDRYEIAA